MKTIALILLLCGYLGGMAQTWDLISPANEKVDYYGFLPAEHFADSNMLWIKNHELDTWNSHDFMLEITGTAPYDDSLMLLTCGSGSYSDGIYRTNINNGLSEVLFYCYKPQTIVQHQGEFFVGYHGGLVSSVDGQTWDSVLSFKTDTAVKYYYVSQQNHIAICSSSTGDFIYHSNDEGTSWTNHELILPVNDADFYYAENKLFVAMGNGSESDGCYVSNDFGITFESVLYADSISAVKFIDNEHLALGFSEKPYAPNGVAVVNPATHELTNINGNLPTLSINYFTTHPLINCINLIACTNSGAYISCDILGIESTAYNRPVNVYPNPFNDFFTIEVNASQPPISCKIFTMSGKMIFNEIKTTDSKYFKWQMKKIAASLTTGCYILEVRENNEKIFSQVLIKK
ncbi:T9SS type A sorting domain-containing protein [Salinivirga cyanobacteriivorans]